MATVSDDGVVRGPTPAPLGSLLVSRGLISAQQLEAALAEQRDAGQPLGAILVQRGFVLPAAIAQALATQHGGILKTEYGWGTGFDARLGEASSEAPPVSPAQPSVHAAGLRLAPAGSVTLQAPGADVPLPKVPADDASAPARPSQLEALELELAAAASENAKLRARLGEVQLEAAAMRAQSEALRREATVIGARVVGLEAAVAALQAEKALAGMALDRHEQALAPE